jgi:hypothetical protein
MRTKRKKKYRSERERERERDKRRNKKLIEKKGLSEKWGLTTEVEWTIEAAMAISEEVKRGTERAGVVIWFIGISRLFNILF